MISIKLLGLMFLLLIAVHSSVGMLQEKRAETNARAARVELKANVTVAKDVGDALFHAAWRLGRKGQAAKMSKKEHAANTVEYTAACVAAFEHGHQMALTGREYDVGTRERSICDIAMVTMLAGFPRRFGLTFKVRGVRTHGLDCCMPGAQSLHACKYMPQHVHALICSCLLHAVKYPTLRAQDLSGKKGAEHDQAINDHAVLFDVEFYFGKAHEDGHSWVYYDSDYGRGQLSCETGRNIIEVYLKVFCLRTFKKRVEHLELHGEADPVKQPGFLMKMWQDGKHAVQSIPSTKHTQYNACTVQRMQYSTTAGRQTDFASKHILLALGRCECRRAATAGLLAPKVLPVVLPGVLIWTCNR